MGTWVDYLMYLSFLSIKQEKQIQLSHKITFPLNKIVQAKCLVVPGTQKELNKSNIINNYDNNDFLRYLVCVPGIVLVLETDGELRQFFLSWLRTSQDTTL